MSELYQHIDSWNGERIFIYVIVFIIILWFFSKKDFGMNVLIALIVGSFVISYLNNRTKTMMNTQDDIQNLKKKAIKPKLNDQSEKQLPIVDFLFSIQDLYAYNPQQYEETIKYTNMFYDKYKQSFVDVKTSHINYGLMQQYKRDALNALMSLIFSLPDDKRMRDKVNSATVIFDGMMTSHLDQISYLIDEDIYKYGYTVDSKVIDYGPKAFNEHDDIFHNFSYEIF